MHSDIFPTWIWNAHIKDNIQINKDLEKFTYELQKKDPDTELRSVVRGWQSRQNFHELEEAKPWLKATEQLFISIVSELKPEEGYCLDLDTAWLNLNPQHAENKMHIHPGADLSGVYYVKKPKDSGAIVLYDPRVQIYPVRTPKNEMRKDRTTIDAKAGDLLVFPGWLQHSVDTNMSKEDRISISFNLCWRKI
tara:strand:+ start:56 stop:634 length:579 start_codon:yes stop_codon:yes gene_type:complete